MNNAEVASHANQDRQKNLVKYESAKERREVVKRHREKQDDLRSSVDLSALDNLTYEEKDRLQKTVSKLTFNPVYAKNPEQADEFVLDKILSPSTLAAAGVASISAISLAGTIMNPGASLNTGTQMIVSGVSMNYLYNKLLDSDSLDSSNLDDLEMIDKFMEDNKIDNKHTELVKRLFNPSIKDKYLSMIGLSEGLQEEPIARAHEGIKRLNAKIFKNVDYTRLASADFPSVDELQTMSLSEKKSFLFNDLMPNMSSLSERIDKIKEKTKYVKDNEEDLYNMLISNLRWMKDLGLNGDNHKVFFSCMEHVRKKEDQGFINKALNFDKVINFLS